MAASNSGSDEPPRLQDLLTLDPYLNDHKKEIVRRYFIHLLIYISLSGTFALIIS